MKQLITLLTLLLISPVIAAQIVQIPELPGTFTISSKNPYQQRVLDKGSTVEVKDGEQFAYSTGKESTRAEFKELAKLPLNKIEVRSNDLNGYKFEAIKGMSSIRELDLGLSSLFLFDFEIIASFENLEDLDMTSPFLDDSTLIEFLEIFKGTLKRLSIKRSHISDRGIKELVAQQKKLEFVEIDSRYVTSASFLSFKMLPNLESLLLQRTSISDEDWVHLSLCKNLEELFLASTFIEGRGIYHLNNLKKLKIFQAMNSINLKWDKRVVFPKSLTTLHANFMIIPSVDNVSHLDLQALSLRGIDNSWMEWLLNQSNLRSLTIVDSRLSEKNLEILKKKIKYLTIEKSEDYKDFLPQYN